MTHLESHLIIGCRLNILYGMEVLFQSTPTNAKQSSDTYTIKASFPTFQILGKIFTRRTPFRTFYVHKIYTTQTTIKLMVPNK